MHPTPYLWSGFALLVLAALAADLGIFHRHAHAVRPKEALAWMIVWISLALGFNVAIYFWFGAHKALEFATAYLVEEALSVDNMFVFFVIFSYFSVPEAYRHRVLFWGILGALVLRGCFIAAGVALLARFQWLLYLFGAFLVVTGVKLFFQKRAEVHPERNPVLKLFRRWVPLVPNYQGQRFTLRRERRLYATPLLLVLVVVEATDVMFALDSIPAVFGITADPLIVYTSNVFAILGLRALFFLLAGMIGQFRYLHFGLAVVLAFVGVKMLAAGVYSVPIGISLAVVAAIIGVSVAASLLAPPSQPPVPVHEHNGKPAPPFPD